MLVKFKSISRQRPASSDCWGRVRRLLTITGTPRKTKQFHHILLFGSINVKRGPGTRGWGGSGQIGRTRPRQLLLRGGLGSYAGSSQPNACGAAGADQTAEGVSCPAERIQESDGSSAQALLALQPLPRISLPRAKSFADFGNEVPIDQGVDISRPFFRRFATWSDLVSRRICFQGSAVDVQRAM